MKKRTRRHFLAAASGLAVGYSRPAMAIATDEEKASVPVIARRVEKVFRAPGRQPNALQAVAGGLWIVDQVDDPGNMVYKVTYEGKVLQQFPTESIHGSGITVGSDGALWIASTWGLKTLKVDPETGKTLAAFETHGAGMNKFGNPTRPSGAHGLEWVGDNYWMAVPASGLIYVMEPETNKIVRSISAPGWRTHGLAWVDGYLWCAMTAENAIYKMDSKNGRLLAKIQLAKDDPQPHGLTARDGVFWYCDATGEASTAWVCKLV
jgi:streptogramin lyase